MPKLTILIPWLYNRDKVTFDLLMAEISAQSNDFNTVDVIDLPDNGEMTTGEKRNKLLQSATTDYVWFVDADDMILPGAIEAILKALKTNPDCVAINGLMTTNGHNEIKWFISKDNQYRSVLINGKEVYHRWTNHITPVRTEIAKQFPFPNKSNREDYEWSVLLRESGLLRKEAKVDIPVYHYQYLTNK